MKEFTIELKAEELQPIDLAPAERELIDRALEATENANAKYSKFRVGAAIRLSDGRIITGANQENASFPLSLCAERTAIFTAQANFPQLPITAIAICARNDNGFLSVPVPPCGSCRQVMVEMEDRYKNKMEVLLYGTEKILRIHSAQDLMPLCFVEANMHSGAPGK